MPSTNIVAFTLLQKPVQDFVNEFLSEIYKLKINYPNNEKDLSKILDNFDFLLAKYPLSEQFFLIGILLSNKFISFHCKDIKYSINELLSEQYLTDLFDKLCPQIS